MNHGISILQGPHQVAQKSSSTTLPLSDASFTSLPSTSFSVKFRFAGFAFAAHAVVGGAAARRRDGVHVIEVRLRRDRQRQHREAETRTRGHNPLHHTASPQRRST
jgi:hypothetical protein